MQHRIKLGNGQILCIEERDDALSIATVEANYSMLGMRYESTREAEYLEYRHPDDTEPGIEAYICLINADGVTINPHSGSTGIKFPKFCYYLTRGLKGEN